MQIPEWVSPGAEVFYWSSSMEQWLKTEVVKVHAASHKIDVKANHDVKASSLRPGNDPMLQALLGPASALQACSSNGGEIMVGTEFGVEQQDEALACLRSVDSELARLLDLHSLPHVALTLALFGREATDLGLFFEQHDARSGRQMDDMLDHLGISAPQASDHITKLKSEWLSVFPKVTMPGDTHSFAGFSKSPLHRVAQYI